MNVLQPGTRIADIELPDQDGITRRLSSLPNGDPLIVHFYRGWFCPKERTYFRRVLLPLSDEIDVSYVRMVSISVEPPAVQAALRAGLEARWLFLSDEQRVFQEALDLREWTDGVHNPFVPTVAVLYPDLTVAEVWNGYWYVGRASIEELKQSVRRVTQAIRSDWEVPRG
jgi:peroxiredoxin